ncbi:replicative DNA helicase [Alteribacter natronophilus]|uniref:replicative DNA helicase n=1 Tax=Alteribacter natronophilus TaxID=2583810 RepID=UPI00110E0A0B|nr:replicative DNA helicase [Alteribacter natronophilus]TMW72771.1 replicative DNA helicase [Alteribacter natronophilus]
MAHQYNVEAEMVLIGSILVDNGIARELSVKPDQLSMMHRQLLTVCMALAGDDEAINLATLHSRLGESFMGQFDFNSMMDAVASPGAYRLYEKMIVDAWKKRQIRVAAEDFLAKTEEVVTDEELDHFLDTVKQAEETGEGEEMFQLKEALEDLFDEALSGEASQGLETGLSRYDRMTNGHGKGQLIILAARPSVGKTALALNMAMGHMERGHFGHVYSLEMGTRQLLNRMIAAKARINSQKMRLPGKRFAPSDWDRYTRAMGELSEANLYMCDRSNVQTSEIYANTRRLKREHPDRDHFVVVDYLQLLQPARRKSNRQEEVTEISRALKTIARDLDVPVIALSQLSRSVEMRQNKRPTLADLRESGSLEQDADVVAFLYREDYYDKTAGDGTMEVIIAKQRDGPVGTVGLGYEKKFNRFTCGIEKHGWRAGEGQV